MTPGLLYALAGGVVFAVGVGGAVLCRNLVRRILAFNVLGSGAFLMLVGLGQRGGAPDPVPQAMVLTGIVVAVAGTALALALVRRLAETAGVEERGNGQRSARQAMPAAPCSANGRLEAGAEPAGERIFARQVPEEGLARGQERRRAATRGSGGGADPEGRV